MSVDEQAPSTRERIQRVALDLFGEQGYEKTSLREIAERLDVTKAALYYHFRSKEAILESVLADYLTEIDEFVDWAVEQPTDAASRRRVIARYAEIVDHRLKAMRFMQQGSVDVKNSEIGQRFRAAMKRVHAVFRDEDAPLVEQVRVLAAVLTVHVGTMSFGEPNSPFHDPDRPPPDPGEVRAAVLEVAGDLITADRD